MAAVISLSDSDDSDDLPPFSERVRQLFNADVKTTKRNTSPQKNVSKIHCISDSDDSRDTIPLSRDRSVSPVSGLLEFPKFFSDAKDNKVNQNGVVSGFSHEDASPVFKLNVEEWKSNKLPVILSSDEDELPALANENAPAINCIPKNDLHMNVDSLSSEDDISIKKVTKSQVDTIFSDQERQCVKKNMTKLHSISDSDDSRDTIPLSRDRSVSPVSSLLEFPKFCSDAKDDSVNENGVVSGLNHEDASPVFKLNIEEWKSNKIPVFLSSDEDELPDLANENIPAVNCVPKKDLHMNADMSSEDDISIKKVTKNQEKRSEKETEKEMRKKIRLEKQKEKDLMKALKASEKEILKSQKPEECMKNMKIVLDNSIFYLEGSQSAVNVLNQNNLKCSFEDNHCKYSVNWYRKVVNIATENQELVREEREELTDTLVVIIPNKDFLKMVHAYVQKTRGRSSDCLSLDEFIVSIKSLCPNSNITCVTVGFQKYMRNIKEESDMDLRTIAKQIPKNASEEAIIELQLQSPVNFNFLENMSEFGNLLHHFTKAIAEAPQRKEKQQQKALAFSWYADVDSQCPVKLAKDKSSFIKLWRQQVQQFQNVGPEVAEAIISHYPSPRLLLKAYKRCATTKDAENLLQDIVVRRGYGPCENQKRIGPELSYKIFLFFTSRDGSKLLKR